MAKTILDYPLTESQWHIAYRVQHTESPAALKLSAKTCDKLRSQLGLVGFGLKIPLHHYELSVFRALFSQRSKGKPTLGDRLGVTRLVLNWVYGLGLSRGMTYVELQDAMVAICIGAILVETYAD